MNDQARGFAELGAALYGGDPPAATEPSSARTEEQIAAAMYDKPELPPEELPAAVQALRDADPARKVYDDATAYTHAGIGEALVEMGIEGVDQQAEHRAWTGALADMGVTSDEAKGLVQLAMSDAPEQAAIEAWPSEAKQALQEAFGDDADQALADARLLIRRDPRVRDFLNRTRMGDHPRVVLLAAQRARAAIAAGSLTRN